LNFRGQPQRRSTSWTARSASAPRFFDTHVTKDPRRLGKALVGRKRDPRAWSCRVGDWRMICDIDDARRIVFVVKIGNRRDVYD
jgi:mRNA-degrading endonuclease RelE of RelBE toxin-antitoxin system